MFYVHFSAVDLHGGFIYVKFAALDALKSKKIDVK